MHGRSLVALAVSVSLLAASSRHARAEEVAPTAAAASDHVESATPLSPIGAPGDLASLAVAAPELAPSAAAWASRPPDVLALTSSALRYPAMTHAMTSSIGLAAKSPTDIRLSRGAKTAIIVTAIVVGVLIIAGVVVVSRPHRHL